MWTLWMLWLGCQPADKDADPDTAGEGDADVDADADSDADPITIPAGVWGGEHWLLRVGEEVFLETDCAHGWLPAPLQADSRGALQSLVCCALSSWASRYVSTASDRLDASAPRNRRTACIVQCVSTGSTPKRAARNPSSK